MLRYNKDNEQKKSSSNIGAFSWKLDSNPRQPEAEFSPKVTFSLSYNGKNYQFFQIRSFQIKQEKIIPTKLMNCTIQNTNDILTN